MVLLPTERLYLQDMELYEHPATVIAVEDHPEGTAVVLDRSAFYPQGGGQPSDKGWITSENRRFTVHQVRLRDDVVYHYGTFEGPAFHSGDRVTVCLDRETRRYHSRIHSAGHLLDIVMRLAGYPFEPGKGYHFPNGPYVEYHGVVPEDEREALRECLEKICNDLIKEGHPVEIKNISYDEVEAYCEWVPDYLTPGQTVRVVFVYGRPGCPCGGTHVRDIREIGSMRINRIRVKAGITRVRYTVDP